MGVGIYASAHDSGLGFIVGTFVGSVLIRGISFAAEKALQRAGRMRAAALLIGVLVVGGAIWVLARAYSRVGG
jgi:hypothetical protein